MKQKKCTGCLVLKNINEFHPHKAHTDYLQSQCKLCKTRRCRSDHLMKAFGINLDQYEQMLLMQNNLCAICKQPETSVDGRTDRVKNLAVDHCHQTNKVRGLLCNSCNSLLGQYEKLLRLNLMSECDSYLLDGGGGRFLSLAGHKSQ